MIVSYNIIVWKKSFILFGINFILQLLYKILFYYFFVKSRNIIILGKNKKSEELKRILFDKQMYNIVAEIEINKLKNVENIIGKLNVTKLIITEEIKERFYIERILDLKLKGIQVFDYLGFIEKIEEKVPVDSINEEWILYGSGFSILYDGIQGKIKRIFDIICAIIIAVLTLPVMIVSAIIVKLESKGPILFRQDRIGLGNKSFKMYKFRSMKIHNENEYSKYAQDRDDRITKFGKMMRKTRIDELPQLWNVLKGDMSFVGPRAEWDKLCFSYMKAIPFYNVRHCVKPGLTGWAQVKYPYGASVEDAFQKLQYDLYYIKHQNLILDFVILFKTIKTVIFGRGR